MRRALTGLAVLFGVVTIACGSNSSSTTTTTKAAAAPTTAAGGGGATTTTKASASTSGGATTTTGSGAQTSTSFTGQGSDAYCALTKQYTAATANLSSNSPDDVKAAIGIIKGAIDQVVAAAPPEIKADFEVVVPVIRKYIAAIEAANYDIAKVDTSQLSDLQSPEFSTASDHITQYDTDVCGITS